MKKHYRVNATVFETSTKTKPLVMDVYANNQMEASRKVQIYIKKKGNWGYSINKVERLIQAK